MNANPHMSDHNIAWIGDADAAPITPGGTPLFAPIPNEPIVEHAIHYASSNGWSVFPAPPGEKKSHKSAAHSDGRKWGQTKDADEIRRDFKQWPDANVGVVCGEVSGIFVIEADTKEGHDVDGIASMTALESEHSPLPATRQAESPSGSIHYYFKHPGFKIKNSASGIAPGVDVRGDGGMVIAPPSVKPGKGVYRWRNDLAITDAPQWLLDRILADKDKPEPEQLSISERALATVRPPNGLGLTYGNSYVEAALRGEYEEVACAREGKRNHQLNISSMKLGHYVGGGVLDEHKVIETMLSACAANGLRNEDGEDQCQATIQSGLAKGKTEPKGIPERQLVPSPRSRIDRPGRAMAPADSVITEAVEIDNGTVTQDGVARVFARRYDDRLRFCHDTGLWYEWTGTHWAKDRVAKAFQFVRELGREYTEDARTGELKEVRKVSFAGGVERFARCDPAFAVTADNWDRDPLLLGTPRGTVDLRTGLLREADPSDCITKVTAIGPAAIPECPRWLQFLDETTGADAELVRFLQQWCGYCLTGLTREHALVFVYGPGGNGKSVFLNVVTWILKQYAATSSMDTFTASKSDRHLTEIAKLHGARLVTASETEEGKAWAESRIKQLTGGDRISARFMRQDEFEFVPQLKLMIVGNHKPVLKNVDDAARRRFLMVPFERKPLVPDRELEQKLMNEAPGILRWMVDGCLDWLANSLTRPASVVAATESYFEEQDLMSQWIADECDLDPSSRYKNAAVGILYAAWTSYCERTGEQPGTVRAFGNSLEHKGCVREKIQNVRCMRGIRLKKRSADDGE